MITNDGISQRAIRFAESFHFTNPQIVRTRPARDEFVARYGTAQATEYRETVIHMDCGANRQETIHSSKLEERQEIEFLLNEGVTLLVVCSAQDVKYNEFLRIDLD
ncbi:MAG: hypothetical protein KDA69_17080 [Planctomycetaceae bacterium]|nr:hypothetical protein [Planctomycetaceae bacterium]